MNDPRNAMTLCPSEDVLLDFISGRLDATNSGVFEQHAESCQHCAALLSGQAAVWQSLDAWKPEPVSEGFNREVWRKIEADAERWFGGWTGVFGFNVWKRFAPLVFVLGVLLTAFVLDHSGRPIESQQVAAQTAATSAPIVITASDADQLEQALDDIQLLNEVDTAPAQVKHVPAGKKTL